jgi:Asp-tRNA(Asn)/Glu-tRNA(Gln) amidotransferase C subunit
MIDLPLLSTLAGLRLPSDGQERVQARVEAVLAYVGELTALPVLEKQATTVVRGEEALRVDHAQGTADSVHDAMAEQFIRAAGHQLLVPSVLGRDT